MLTHSEPASHADLLGSTWIARPRSWSTCGSYQVSITVLFMTVVLGV
jgi:hypothetical protein